MKLPDVVHDDLEGLLGSLEQRGFVVESVEVGPMHSYLVKLKGPSPLTIIADRGQLMLEGARDQLEPVGLWRAFDDRDEFGKAVLAFVGRL